MTNNPPPQFSDDQITFCDYKGERDIFIMDKNTEKFSKGGKVGVGYKNRSKFFGCSGTFIHFGLYTNGTKSDCFDQNYFQIGLSKIFYAVGLGDQADHA